jgi:hypothetical protein
VGNHRCVEQASVKLRINLHSPQARSLFARFFDSLQLNVDFVSEVAPMHLKRRAVVRVEQVIRSRLVKLRIDIEEGITAATGLCAANQLIERAGDATPSHDFDVAVFSSFGRRYLEAIKAFDWLMHVLLTLETHEVIPVAQANRIRARHKQRVRGVAMEARRLADELRQRMRGSSEIR